MKKISKRLGLYEKIRDYDNLKYAFYDASSGEKGKYYVVQKIGQNLDYYITKLQRMIDNDNIPKADYRYKTIVDKGKVRKISVVPFYPFRILHHAMMRILRPYFDNRLIPQTYSAIIDRGWHKCAKDIFKQTIDFEYYITLDIRKYYDNIDQDMLCYMIHDMFKDERINKLFYDIIYDFDKGVPIGSYTSQYLANLYVKDIDYIMIKKNPTYKRYMDNIIILGNDKEELKSYYFEIKEYCRKLGLSLHGYTLDKIDNGIHFLGYLIDKHKMIPKKSKMKEIRHAAKKIRQITNKGKTPTKHRIMSYGSKSGCMKHIKRR